MSATDNQIVDTARSVFRRLPLWLWRIFAVGILLILYANVLARGITYSFPDFGTKLAKTPMLGFLAKYEETKNLQISHAFSVLFLVVVFASWEIILRMACGADKVFDRFEKPEVAKRIMLCIGAAVLCTDCWFYYAGITNSGTWQSTTFSISALLATIGFIAVNVAVTMFSVFLTPREDT